MVLAGSPYVKQGTDEWHEQRLGKVTASRFKDMMTNGRGTSSMGQTAYTYMWDLIAEKLTGKPQDNLSHVKAIEWGNENEPQARAFYSLYRDVRVKQTGFLTHPSFPDAGGSPDGLVDDDPEGAGGAEIKCPHTSRIHLQYITNGGVPNAYKWQVQGLMWITGREWWDFVSFDPRMEKAGLMLYVHREHADLDMFDELSERTLQFIEQLKIKLSKLKEYRHDFNS